MSTELNSNDECFKYFKEYPGKLMPFTIYDIDESQLIYVRAVESIRYNSRSKTFYVRKKHLTNYTNWVHFLETK